MEVLPIFLKVFDFFVFLVTNTKKMMIRIIATHDIANDFLRGAIESWCSAFNSPPKHNSLDI